MDDNGSKLESVLKDSLQAQTTSAADELSLDRFFQMAGVEPSQLEALCSSERDGGTPVTHDSTEKLHAYDTAITLEQKYNGMGATAPSRAEEEANSYRRKLAAYQEGQQKQALLIQKLQAKVLQYKKRTSDLDLEVEQLKSELETSDKLLQTTTENLNLRVEASEARARALEQERSHQLEGTLVKLHEEQQRANELIQTNEILRDQLNQAVQANQGLSQDVARLTLAWRNAAQQLDKRETEWREEESAFNDYFAAEHSRLLALWRAVVGLRRQFGDLRQHTDRDLIYARNELTRYVRSIQSVCGNLEVNIRAAEAEAQSHLKRESKHATAVELEAADRVRSLTESLARSQARLAETEHKMTELVAARERLASQLADRDRILSTMSQLRSGISYLDGSESKHRKKAFKRGKRSLHPESEASEEGDESVQDLGTSVEDNEDHLKATKRLIEHTHVMHRALGQIAQLVISDSLIADADEAEEPTLNPQHPDWSAGRDSARSLEARSQKSEESLVAHGRPDEERVGAQSTSSLLAIEVHDGAESDQTVQRMYAISPSEMGQLRRLAHSKYQAGSSSHLAESALSAVQAALNRRAAHVHRLRYRTHGLRDKVQTLTRRAEELDTERRRVVEQVGRMREELEKRNLELDKVSRERDRTKHNLNLMTEERKLGETARITMSEQIRELQHELDRQRNLVLEANKQTEELTGSRERLQNEHDRLVREFSTLKGALEGAEERAAAYREELTRIRESLRRTELEKDVLVQEKADAVGNVSRIQTRVDELEQKLYKSNFLENQLKDKVAQLQVMIDTHERDNQHLTQQNAMAHSSELRLTEERASLRAERHQLRDELDKLYMERGNLNTELEHVREQASRLETAKSRLEAEASELSHERLALVEALNSAERQKAAMLDDLNAFKRDAERQSSLLSRLNEEKEVLSKQKAEMLIQLSTLELATRQQQEHIIRLKGEKETLESSLFEAQQSIDHLQNKQNSLDREIAELKLRRDSLQAELLRAHTNFQVELDKSQRNQKELGNQLNTELEDLRQALNQAEKRSKEAEDACLQAVQRADQAVAVMGRKQMLEAESISDREIELQRAAEEANRLTRALLTAQRERDEARLQAEQERQRALLRAADERAGLQQRVTLQQETITELQSALDRSQRENSVREEQERSALKKATEEVRNFRNQLEDSNTKHEKEARDLRIRIHELEAQREQLIQETNELRLKIRLAEEFRTGNRAELVESTSRIRAVEEAIDAAKRECVDLRQKTAELEREKMALDASNDELRRQLKTAEMERVELVRLTNVTRSQLQGTEMDRTTAEKRIADLQENVREVATSAAEARREASELRNQAKKLVFEKESLEQELNELRQHLKDSQSKEVLAKRENSSMKQRITELEGTKSSLQSELSSLERQLQDTEDALRSRERASTQVAEEWDRDYRRLDETKKNLEGKVEQSTLVISELRGSLAETQAHLLGLESELTDTMASKQEAEARLSAIHSILRRLLGFRQSQYADALELLDKVDPFRSHLGADTSATDGLEDTGDDRSRRSGGPRSYELLEAAIRTRGQEDDAEDEWELRRVAERIMNDRLAIDHVMSKSKLLQRTRHRFYKGTEMYPPAIMRVRSTLRSRRSKSSSPPRERMDAALVRPTSTERYPDPRDRSKNTCLEIMQSRTHPTAGELALVDQSPVRLHTWRSYLSSIRYRGLPGSDLDPEAVRMVLRDFLRHLVKMERERDTTEMRAKVHAEQVAQLKRELTEADQRVLQMQTSLSSIERGKLEVLDNLNTMRCTVSEQEVALHRMEKECEAIREKLAHAEQQLTLCETEKSQLQNRLEKMKSSEMKMDEERRQLLKSLDDAETRYTEAEVSRRRLEGDLKRSKATIAELEKEKESLQKRLNKTMRQNTELDSRIYTMQAGSDEVASALNQANEKLNDLRDQLDQERSEQATLKQQLKEIREELEQTKKRELSSEQERRILQERLEVSRSSLNETKVQLQEALERLQDLQAERSDGTLRRAELETQLRQLTNTSADQQQTNEDLQTRLTTISCENTALTERNAELLRQVNNLGLEKHELQSESKRLAKELNQLKKTIDRIDRERSWEQEQSSKMLIENKEHLLTIRQLEEENLDLRRDVQKLQTLMTKHEDTQAARLMESNTKQRMEIEMELERQRRALAQMEKSLQSKERSHRHKVRSLEEQVSILKDRLAQETAKRTLPSTKPPSTLTTHASPSQPNLYYLSSPTTTDVEMLMDTRSRTEGSLAKETFLPGYYKPTTAPSRYDPYFYQVTGSIPSRLERSYGSGRVTTRDGESVSATRTGCRPPTNQQTLRGTYQSSEAGEGGDNQNSDGVTPGTQSVAETAQSSITRPTGQAYGRHSDTPTSELNRTPSDSTVPQ